MRLVGRNVYVVLEMYSVFLEYWQVAWEEMDVWKGESDGRDLFNLVHNGRTHIIKAFLHSVAVVTGVWWSEKLCQHALFNLGMNGVKVQQRHIAPVQRIRPLGVNRCGQNTLPSFRQSCITILQKLFPPALRRFQHAQAI